MKYFRFLAAAAALLALGGCAQYQSFQQKLVDAYQVVTTAKVDYRQALAAVQGFETLQRSGEVYLSLPTCSTKQGAPCHNRNATKTINALFAAGRVARSQIIGYMDANPCTQAACPLLPQGLFDSIQSVVTNLNQVYDTYKVTTGG